MLVSDGISSAPVYTVGVLGAGFIVSYCGLARDIHQTIRQFTMSYSTVKKIELPFGNRFFTLFPQGLLLPTERIF